MAETVTETLAETAKVVIGAVRETAEGERRVALTPETCKKLVAAGARVRIERGLGDGAHASDAAYADAGAELVEDAAAVLNAADIVVCVQPPSAHAITGMKPGAALVGMLQPQGDAARGEAIVARNIVAFPLERLPRTTRAQAMDILSSQAGMAGYKAMLIAAQLAPRFFPMLTTAAGTIRPSKVLVIGAGVAGLQAIATCKRLGAMVEAYDVRSAAREQIESLGAKFIDVPYLTDEEREIAQGSGGYARAMPADWMRRQAELVHERAKLADIIITTALIPGRAAPVLISEETVKAMKPGSVIVDLAVEQGGNCPLSELGKTVIKHGVYIVGEPNLATLVAADASALYARNVLDFLKLIIDKDAELLIDREDEIIKASLVCAGSEILRK